MSHPSIDKKVPSVQTTLRATTGFASLRMSAQVSDGDDIAPDNKIEAAEPVATNPRRSISARQCLVDAAFDSNVSAEVAERIFASAGTMAVVIVVPPTWVYAFERRMAARLGSRWFVIAHEVAPKKSIATKDDEVGELLAKDRSVVGIASSASFLPSSLIAASDLTIEIAMISVAVIVRAIERFTGQPMDSADPIEVGGLLEISHILPAFRRGSSPAEIVSRLAIASSRLKPKALSIGSLPRLETAVEYGAARQWALQLIADFKEWQEGRLDWQAVSARVCIHSPPGFGKTMLGKIVAAELGVPLIASSVADLFANSQGFLDSVIKASRSVYFSHTGPRIVMWDEVDAMPSRETMAAERHGSSWWTPFLTDWFLSLDQIAATPGVVIITCTNHINRIDPALLRPGRLDRKIEIVNPDEAGIINIFRTHLKDDLFADDIAELGIVALGRSPAEIAQFVRTARRAARMSKRALELDDVIEAVVPREYLPVASLKRITVYEAGHAVVAFALGGADKVHALIVGGDASAAGSTAFLRSTDDFDTRDLIENRTIMMLAGRAAEIACIGTECSHAGGDDASDLGRATAAIGAFHASHGLGSTLAYLGPSSDAIDLVRRDPTLRAIVDRHLRALQNRAIEIVTRHRAAVEAIAAALADRRHLTGDVARAIFDANPPVPDSQYSIKEGQ